jgi:hypothetical protein
MRMTGHRGVLALALLLALAGCRRGGGNEMPPAPPPPAPPPAPFPPATRLYYDNSGGIQDSLRLVIKEPGDLTTVWQQATSRQSSPPPAPAIDFGNEMVIVVGAGRMRPDDQIAVDSVYRTRELNTGGQMVETLNVVVRTTTGCRRFNADAYPLDVVRVRRFEGPVKFIEQRSQAQGCTPPEE